MNRERFNSIRSALNLSPSSLAFAGGRGAPDPALLRLSPSGWVPNNPRLPVLFYRSVLSGAEKDCAAQFESQFSRNGWPAQWHSPVYDFHHYHSTAHEVLGFAEGEARLMLGGESGVLVHVRAGDVLVLPVGTGHRQVKGSSDFLAVGGYPAGQSWDICRSEPSPETASAMETLSFPASDPVSGRSGALRRLWIPKKAAVPK